MKNLRSIVAGTDFSEAAESALAEAFRIAAWDRTELTVVYVVDAQVVEETLDQVDVEKSSLLESAERKLKEQVLAIVGDGYPYVAEVRLGHPFEELLGVCQEKNADLLVLGAQGSSRDEKRVGVLATSCVRKAPLPVLLIRSAQAQPFGRVVACIGSNETSRDLLLRAWEIAEQDGAELIALSVVRPAVSSLGETGLGLLEVDMPPGRDDYQRTLALRRLEDLVDDVREERGFRSRVKTAAVLDPRPDTAIINYLKKHDADLAVMGTVGRTGWRRLLMGTTAEHVVQKASSSVLAIKPDNFEFHP